MQVGAGTGYYSAVLAEIVGRKGRVVAVEYDAELASRAKMNLAQWPQIKVVYGDGTRHDPGETDAVVVFAGATHPAAVWLDCLADEGRLLIPLTAASGGGFLLRAIRNGAEFEAQSLGRCGFFPCIGGRNQKAAGRLRRALRLLGDQPIPVRALFRGEPPESAKDRMWYTGPGFWLSH
jgi:protein-L-isoaspartate(D-aspartate) O-methyltransferase